MEEVDAEMENILLYEVGDSLNKVSEDLGQRLLCDWKMQVFPPQF